MKTWKKVLIGVGALLLLLGGVIGFNLFNMIQETGEKINQITLTEVDLTKVTDGTYEGVYDAGAIYVKVSVAVSQHQIQSIDLIEHRNGKGKPAEVLIDLIKQKQSLTVDDVSGATSSSRVIKKAVEIALTKGLEK